MPTTTFERVTDDAAVEIEVEFTLTGGSPAILYGLPENCEPGEAPEVEIEGASFLATGEETELTAAEIAKVETYILENVEQFDDDGDMWSDHDYLSES